jgi:type I restriction enzyme S subunit
LGLIKDYNKLEISEAPSRARQKLERGDLLLSSLSGSLKSIAVFETIFDNAICSTGFYVIKKSKDYNNYYLWALFRSDILQMLLQRESSGAIMSAINREALSNLKIPLPPLSVQNKIADEVKKRMQKAEQLQKESKELLEKAKLEVEKIILG